MAGERTGVATGTSADAVEKGLPVSRRPAPGYIRCGSKLGRRSTRTASPGQPGGATLISRYAVRSRDDRRRHREGWRAPLNDYEFRALAEEQAALPRVAMLVAPPSPGGALTR